jgi:hypothetical protein
MGPKWECFTGVFEKLIGLLCAGGARVIRSAVGEAAAPRWVAKGTTL